MGFESIIELIQLIFIFFINLLKTKFKKRGVEHFILETCNDLANKNIIYTKLIQFDIIKFLCDDKELNYSLKKFCYSSPYNVYDINYDVFEKLQNYTNTNGNILTIDNNFKPINSGTVALVYKAKLNDKDIIIKVLRKNIRRKITRGIDTVILIFKIINFFKQMFGIDSDLQAINILIFNRELLIEQSNFLNEINNTQEFDKICRKTHRNIYIPHVYKEFSYDVSNEIIVMEYINGKTFAELNNYELADLKKKYDTNLHYFIMETYTLYNLIHCDLHTGNIMCSNDNKIYLIDFGIIHRINDNELKLIQDLFFCIKNNNIDRLLKTVVKLICKSNFDETFKKLKSIESISLLNSEQIIDSHTFNKLLNDVLKLDIKVDKGHVILLSLVSLFSLLELLANDAENAGALLKKFFSNIC
jgi:predicted unusual protein kinase regulating ubiquinone biosynthesis (AarF/ABC1/UbiB family)